MDTHPPATKKPQVKTSVPALKLEMNGMAGTIRFALARLVDTHLANLNPNGGIVGYLLAEVKRNLVLPLLEIT